MAAKIQQRNEVVTKQCAELQAKLSADGLSSVVLKGQSVANLYGAQLSALRQSGDIDLWVDAPRDRTVEYVMKRCPTTEVNFQHVHYHVYEDTDVELHMVPVSRYNPRRNKILQEYFDSEVKRQCANRKKIRIGGAEVELSVPTEDFQLVHQLLHVYSHYVYEGVGLRQLMDLYFAQRAMKNGEELFRVQELFRRLGLGRFVAASQWVLEEVMEGGNQREEHSAWRIDHAQDVAEIRSECSHDPFRLPGHDLWPVVSPSHRYVAQEHSSEI